MKIQIRRGVFETNSSSVHTLSISKDKDILSKVKNISEIVFEQDSTLYINYFLVIFLNKN